MSITSAEEVMISSAFVRLSVSRITQKLVELIFTKIVEKVAHGLWK